MGYQPWYTGQTYPILQIPLNVELVADNITGMTANAFSMTLRRIDLQPPVDTAGTGTFAIVTANPAVVTYQFSSADVLQEGSYLLFVKGVFPNPNTGNAVYDPIGFTLTKS